MCGIIGIFPALSDIDSSLLHFLRHRGPDDKGWLRVGRGLLGHARLSIIDLSSNAHQPMTDESGRYTIVFNGEVYNYRDLQCDLRRDGHDIHTQSDTEVVLIAYKVWGAACLERFRGMFAFAIYDKEEDCLFLARDRYGIKPLVYSFQNGFVFASELEALIASSLIRKTLNQSALADFVSYGHVAQPQTIFDGVYSLMPGYWMKVSRDLTYTSEPYYELEQVIPQSGVVSYEEAVRELRSLLEEASRYHMVADVEVGAFLSGGIDSSAVVALMREHVSYPIKTFSVGFERQSEVDDERAIAKLTAERLGCEHHEVVLQDGYISDIFDDFIKALGQPSIDGINTFIVSRATADYVKVALSGLGGDEIFGGYSHFETILNESKKKRSLSHSLLSAIHTLRPNRFTSKSMLMGIDPEIAIDRVRRFALKGYSSDFSQMTHESTQSTSYHGNLDAVQRISLHEMTHYLRNTLLRDADVLSMRHSLEVRPILLDHKLVEYAISLPSDFKVSGGDLKRIFVDSVKDLIPDVCWQQKKRGFEMPFASWMNGVLNERVCHVVHSPHAKDLFTRHQLKLVRQQAKQCDIRRSFWKDFVLLSWLERTGLHLPL